MKLALLGKSISRISKLSVTGKIIGGFSTVFALAFIANSLVYWKVSDHVGIQTKEFIILLCLVTLVVTMGIALLLSRSLSYPIKALTFAAEQLAKGDFTVGALTENREDELGDLARSFNHFVSRMRHLVTQTNHTVNLVATSSEELKLKLRSSGESTERAAMQMQELAIGSERQVGDLDTSRTTITEMSGGIQQIAASIQEVSYSATEASELSSEGTRAIESAVTQMEAIHSTVEELSSVIEGLGHRSSEIGNIVNVITDISTRTNLLSLNAAIEAARAGEQGRGFAIVASEVRKLAEQSANSAKQIGLIISGIQHETERAASTMEHSTREVREGMTVIHEAGHSFTRIHQAVTLVADSTQEVAAAVEELSAGSEQIVSAISSIADLSEASLTLTQDVVAASDEQLAATDEINRTSYNLLEIATKMKVEFNQYKV
ncbi:methyl-accepting chemotaxis protein [Paenibacillus taihuensis]|uniref:Methyl-accepting chemotaxis protein n=1 Tax=Paenibacillus taihuensis TaxID=1156355 RepID=A0A3D9QU63_9BACL|nr:methyl-accepting chemotaxis protein [Paenibacillus taihuensis]REE67311.1 methyl-accepting chemotaxis protein [Paenibacillus taihuensis]